MKDVLFYLLKNTYFLMGLWLYREMVFLRGRKITKS